MRKGVKMEIQTKDLYNFKGNQFFYCPIKNETYDELIDVTLLIRDKDEELYKLTFVKREHNTNIEITLFRHWNNIFSVGTQKI